MRTSLVRTIIVRVCAHTCVCVCRTEKIYNNLFNCQTGLLPHYNTTYPLPGVCSQEVYITNSCSSLTKFGKYIFLSFSASWFPSQIQLIQPLLACFELSLNDWQSTAGITASHMAHPIKRKLGSSMEHICVSVCVCMHVCACASKLCACFSHILTCLYFIPPPSCHHVIYCLSSTDEGHCWITELQQIKASGVSIKTLCLSLAKQVYLE